MSADSALLAPLRQRRGAVCILHVGSGHTNQRHSCHPPSVAVADATVARRLGFSFIFSTDLSRHLRDLAEDRELERRNSNAAGGSHVPLISCECPVCAETVLRKYPALASLLSPCRTTFAVQSALVRGIWAERHNVNPADLYQVALVHASEHCHDRKRLCALMGMDNVVTYEELAAVASSTPVNKVSQLQVNSKVTFDEPFSRLRATNNPNVLTIVPPPLHSQLQPSLRTAPRTVWLNTPEEARKVLDDLACKQELYANTIIRLNHCIAFKDTGGINDCLSKHNHNHNHRHEEKWWRFLRRRKSHQQRRQKQMLSEEQAYLLKAVALYDRGHLFTDQALPLQAKVSPEEASITKAAMANHANKRGTQLSHKTSKTVPKAATTDINEVVVLFGSESGSTERQAELFATKARARGFKVRVLPCDKLDAEGLKSICNGNTTAVIAITSTVGDGEFPENARGLYARLCALADQGAQPLRGVCYAVCGFGSSAFGDNFCAAARRLRAKMHALGGRELASFVACDVSNTSAAEERFALFTEDVLKHKNQGKDRNGSKSSSSNSSSGSDLVKVTEEEDESDVVGERVEAATTATTITGKGPKRPASLLPPPPRGFVRIPLVGSVEVTPAGHDRPVREFTFGLAGAQGLARYHCGDHVQILPRNDSARVAKLLARLRVDGSTVLDVSRAGGFIPPRVTARELFEQYLDVFSPCSRRVAEAVLARSQRHPAITTNTSAVVNVATMSAPAYRGNNNNNNNNGSAMVRLSTKLSLGDALLCCPGINLPLGALAGVVPRIQPRTYSVACAPPLTTATASQSVTLSVALVQRWQQQRQRRRRVPGLTTGYLWGLDPKAHPLVAARVVRGPGLVADVADGTIVMCGLGSGIAPFLGLMQQRARLLRRGKLRGRAVLCYGTRSRADFAYGALVAEYLRRGVLSAALCAVGNEGVFVQDKIAENAALFTAALREPGARLYYCGPLRSALNGEVIPASVLRAFAECLNSDPAKNAIIDRMKREHRIVVEAH